MPKKKNWFQWMRDYLFPSTDKQEGKRKKRKKRWVFRWMKTKRSPSLAAPPLSMQEGINDGLKRQCNGNKSNLANGSEFSAEGVAAKDVSGVATSSADSPRSMTIMTNHEKSISNSEKVRCRKNSEGRAATKIQTAFRAYLARKALRALKGLVRLQAIIRGRAVRRQAVATLKCLQSIVNIQSQVCATRYQMACEKIQHKEIRDSGDSKYEGLKIEVKNQRRWDDSLLTEEEEKFLLSTRTEAVTRRERMKAYTFNGRHSAEFEDGSASRRLRNWADQYVTEHQVPQKEEIKRVDTVGGKQLRLTKTTQVSHQPRCIHGLDSPTLILPRRSLHHKRRTLIMADERADSSLPTYMASTESAKAKARSMSMSSPRRQRALHPDAYSDGDSPYKCKISPISSINSERTWSGTSVTAKNIGCTHCSYPRYSPSLKGFFDPGCHRKSGSSKDLGLELQSWLLNWN